jgi:tetratricopeptide (TPR) repeat protein
MTPRLLLSIILASGLALSLCVTQGQCIFIKPTLDDIPIAKLVDNLEKAIARTPQDAKLRFNLARAHAMAYAEKVESCKVFVGKEMNGPWFGFTPKFVPFTPKVTEDQAQLKLAQDYLAKAITRYKEAIELDPKYLPAKLGLGWCLEQSKSKAEAVKIYREVIEEGWRDDMNRKALPLGGHAITAEAAGYLVPLLHAERDKEEIATLEERVNKLKKLPRPVTPVVVPLKSGLGAADMVNPLARVRFDADGSGLKEEWTWFTRDAGILVFDHQGKGNITSALQWFGNVTFWMFWENGYEALSALDANGDGVLTGQELIGIAIWVDANGDGVCQPGEIRSLASLGIVSISCRYEIDRTHPDSIPYSRTGITFRDQTTRPTFDVLLHKAPKQH